MVTRSVGPSTAVHLQTSGDEIGVVTGPDDVPLSAATLQFLLLERSGSDTEELVSAFLALIRPFGFGYVAILDMARAAPDPMMSVRFTTFRPEWLHKFEADRRDADDPIWHAALTSADPFRWSSVTERAGRADDETIFYRSIGLADGMTIPVFSPLAARATVYLGADRPIELGESDEAMVTLAACVLASRLLRRLGTARRDLALTLREREVLTWTALGKSARDIGVILDLSEKTVARHLLNIREKLKCANTVQVVAVALRERLIAI